MGTKTKQGHIFNWNKDKTLAKCKNCGLKSRILKVINRRSFIDMQQYWIEGDWVGSPYRCHTDNEDVVSILYKAFIIDNIESAINITKNKCPIHGLDGVKSNNRYKCPNKYCFFYWTKKTISDCNEDLDKAHSLLSDYFGWVNDN